MSPRKVGQATPSADSLADRIAIELGVELHEEGIGRGWTLEDVARRARLADAWLQRLEAGGRGSLDAYARLATTLGLTPSFTLKPRRAAQAARSSDPVHSAMGEVEASHLRAHGREVLLDEPYQHYQFAGRADVVAIDRERRAILHIENRTRFPDVQGFAGSYNAKRAYLAPDLAKRLGIEGGFRSVTHVVAALWSSEVIHSVRLLTSSFTAICPHPTAAFAAWWDGTELPPGESSTLILFDPMTGRRRSRRQWVGLDAIARVGPRYRGYAHMVEVLKASGRALGLG